MRVALYVRVSRAEQVPETQLQPLRDYVAARGWTDVVEYVDHGVSGTKDRRPALDAMMAQARARRLDAIIVVAFDRFARSTQHLVNALAEFDYLGVAFVSLREAIDTASPMGRAMFVIVGAIAELERSLIVERIHAGLARARRQGKRLGRRRVPCGNVDYIRNVIARTGSLRRAAKELDVSVGTLRNRLRASGA